MPPSLKQIKKPIIHNRYLDGKLVDPYEQTRDRIIVLEDGSFICTCGVKMGTLRSLAVHQKTLNHLIMTRQIDEYHPTLNCHQQRDILLSSKNIR